VAKAGRLAEILRAEGFVVHENATDLRPRLESLSDELREQVLDRYRALGGQAGLPQLLTHDLSMRPGTWDMRVEDDSADHRYVELDEERHFNHWRAVTLDAAVYDEQVRWVPVNAYRALCADRKDECLRAATAPIGNWWTAKSERQFGPPGPQGELEGLGSPRWRQRAMYDFMKDLGPLAGFPRVARISIWERLPGHEPLLVKDALGSRFLGNPGPALVRMIEKRWA
jgi:hypothetical protein